MITVYEIKSNGFIGGSREIDPREGVGQGWTYSAPPAVGSHKWEHSTWVAYDEPDAPFFAQDLDTLAVDIRSERSKLLSDTDWRFRSDLTPSSEWVDYCQALRDITLQDGFPLAVEWPPIPV